MKATPGEALIITLGWDLDAFWSAVESAPLSALEEAHAILSTPDEPDMIEETRYRLAHGLETITRELARRRTLS